MTTTTMTTTMTMRTMTTSSSVAIALVLAASSVAAADPTSSADVDSYYYMDPDVSVATVQGRGAQALAGRWSLLFGATADRITVQGAGTSVDDDDDDDRAVTARRPAAAGIPDAVTAASSVVLVDAGPEWRFEGILGARYTAFNNALVAGIRGFGSVEDDYSSVGAIVDVGTERRARTIALSGYVGIGRDRSTPLDRAVTSVVGESQRAFGGVSIGIVTTPRLVLYGGASVNVQRGLLSSPYRTASLENMEVPEVLPDLRARGTVFAQAALSLTRSSALHARLGAYLDSWGVRAAIPELALVNAIGEHLLFSLGYRLYAQSAANFHENTYTRIERYMSGDARLDALVDHSVTSDLAWTWASIDPDAVEGSLTVRAGYTFSALSRDTLQPAHAIHAGLSATY